MGDERNDFVFEEDEDGGGVALTPEQEDAAFSEAAARPVSDSDGGGADAGGGDAGGGADDGNGDAGDGADSGGGDADDGADSGGGDADDGADAGGGDADDGADAGGGDAGGGANVGAAAGAAGADAADAGAAKAKTPAQQSSQKPQQSAKDSPQDAVPASLFGGRLDQAEASRLYLELVGDEDIPDPDNEGATIKVAALAAANPDIFAANAMALNRSLLALREDILARVGPALSTVAAEAHSKTLSTLAEKVAGQFAEHSDVGEILGTDAFETWAAAQSPLLQETMDQVDPENPASLPDADYVLAKFKRDTKWKSSATARKPAADKPRNSAAAAGLRSRTVRRNTSAAAADGDLSDEEEDLEFEQTLKQFARE
jgi:hypothetical protein